MTSTWNTHNKFLTTKLWWKKVRSFSLQKIFLLKREKRQTHPSFIWFYVALVGQVYCRLILRHLKFTNHWTSLYSVALHVIIHCRKLNYLTINIVTKVRNIKCFSISISIYSIPNLGRCEYHFKRKHRSTLMQWELVMSDVRDKIHMFTLFTFESGERTGRSKWIEHTLLNLLRFNTGQPCVIWVTGFPSHSSQFN